jgi:hypothetical protein
LQILAAHARSTKGTAGVRWNEADAGELEEEPERFGTTATQGLLRALADEDGDVSTEKNISAVQVLAERIPTVAERGGAHAKKRTTVGDERRAWAEENRSLAGSTGRL